MTVLAVLLIVDRAEPATPVRVVVSTTALAELRMMARAVQRMTAPVGLPIPVREAPVTQVREDLATQAPEARAESVRQSASRAATPRVAA